MAKYIPDPSQLPPDEEGYRNPLWEDTQEPVEIPQDTVAREVQEKPVTKSPSPASAPKKVAPAAASKVGRKPTGSAMTNSERQAKWRAANREVALARQREAMKKIRQKVVE